MKIGKQPKRYGKPSQKFLDKQAQREEQAYLEKKSDVKRDVGKGSFRPYQRHVNVVPAGSLYVDQGTGKAAERAANTVMVYLDDERPCPNGWTLAKTPKDFFDLLKRGDDYLDLVTHISLDWYLGSNQIDGVQVVTQFAEMFFDAHHEGKTFLPNLKGMGFHSSDREQAKRMWSIMNEVLEGTDPSRLDKIRLRLGMPRY